MRKKRASVALLLPLLWACAVEEEGGRGAAAGAELPAILLVTLDTTRADVVAPEGDPAVAPAFAALADRGVRYRQAWSPAPTTLPAHASLLTGLYPAEHGVHENARVLAGRHPLATEALAAAGYETAAFVSAYPLDRQFGLARGFATYDDDFGDGRVERPAAETVERALAWLAGERRRPVFLWVHFFDPHDPYEPPEPYGSRFPDDPYLGEVAAMDAALGRLLAAFEERHAADGVRILVIGDHGEGLGEQGEAFHGHLLSQGVMRVPLVVLDPRRPAGEHATPVSTRRVYDTLLAWAGLPAAAPLEDPASEVVLGEAMKPFLDYGWQPQVMALEGRFKAVRAGGLEVYDVVADPLDEHDLAGEARLSREQRRALADYPLPETASVAAEDLSDEELRRLASLGYVSWEGRAQVRSDAPRPRDMAHLFADLDLASGHFVRGEYARAIPLFERVLATDPENLSVLLRLAAAHSARGEGDRAMATFRRAEAVDPGSLDVRHYMGLHLLSVGRWQEAEPLLATVVEQMAERLPAVEGLGRIRLRQGRPAEAEELLTRVVAGGRESVPALLDLGAARMELGDTAGAIAVFERARAEQGHRFEHHLELGVLYLAARRLEAARDALDAVPASHPGHAMALFKRAQVSVLLGEPDRRARVRAAREGADVTTRSLIATEPLFWGEG